MSARLRIAAVVPLLLLGAACTDDGGSTGCATDIEAQGDDTVVVEGDPWSGYAAFRDEQLLDGTPYDLVYVEQLCQDARARDLSEGRADFIVTSLDQYILQEPEGTIVGVIDQSLGADALVLNSRQYSYLDTIEDLPILVEEYAEQGEKPVIAYTGSSPSEMLLNELSNTVEELRLDRFELVSVDQSATAYSMLESEEAQLAVLWEPDTSAAVEAGFAVALDSGDVPDAIVDVLVARDDLLAERPELVEAVVGQFYAQMDRLIADPDALREYLQNDDPRLDYSEVERLIDGIHLYTSAEASAFMNDDEFPVDQPQIEQSIDSIGSLLALIHSGVDPDRARVDGSIVKGLAR